METPRPPTRLAAAASLLALGAWLAASALFAFGEGRSPLVRALNSVGLLLAVVLDLGAIVVSLLALLDGDRSRYAWGGLIAGFALILLALVATLVIQLV